MNRITSETLKRWRQQGVEDNQSRCYIFNNEWELLCDMALQSLSIESVRSEARNAALEEAAQAIEPASGLSDDGILLIRKGQAAIRALKEPAQSPARVAEGERSDHDVVGEHLHSTELRK